MFRWLEFMWSSKVVAVGSAPRSMVVAWASSTRHDFPLAVGYCHICATLHHSGYHATLVIVVAPRCHSWVRLLVISSSGSLCGTFGAIKTSPQGKGFQIRPSSDPLSKVHSVSSNK